MEDEQMKKMGRPKGEDNKEYTYTVRMNEDTLRRLEAYCERLQIAKSQAVREAIEKMIEDEKKD